ncbi:YugN family protein [Paenibacillus sp. GCM10027626]|uniref:YugN family protein n=1 Tax=Paenibacillus sp. GCM10027626 TaxID=3273411 RepID=UPI0036316A58
MIIENTGLNGITSDLAYLDESAEKVGFVRWQWEYYRATYDFKIEDRENHNDYYLRISTRAIEGKLESPHAVLQIESVYIGRATFPHGLTYDLPVPQPVMNAANQRIQELKKLLAS